MKVIVKRPGKDGEIAEVEGLPEINKICGNVDDKGNGINRAGSDIRMRIYSGVDMYVKEDAINNFDLEENLWAPGDMAVLFGNAVFAGYDEKVGGYGVCSLTDEQIQVVFDFIARQRTRRG